MTDKVSTLPVANRRQQEAALDDTSLDMLRRVREIEAGILDGSVIGLAGVVILDGEAEQGLEMIEEGYSLNECEVAATLRMVAREYDEQWEAERFGELDSAGD